MASPGPCSTCRSPSGCSRDGRGRRDAIFDTVNERSGESISDIGCGGRFYVREGAQMVGPTGRACGVDISDDQISAARKRCAKIDWVTYKTGNASQLPHDDDLSNAVYDVRVFEFLPEVGKA